LLENNFILVLLFYCVLTFVISYFSLSITTKHHGYIYTLSRPNHKSSSYHKPLLRGVGIIYILPLITVMFLNKNLFTLQEFSLLASSMILGYVDDKRELSQKLKLVCLIIIFLIFNSADIFLGIKDVSWMIINIVLFIFFVLFFNQIDGINGLSALTFITFISLIFFFTNYTIMAAPLFISITVPVLVYLNFNMRLKTVLQGDAGSYFIGAFSYLIISRYESYTEIVYSIFFLAPLLLDVSLTSISRVWYGKKLLEGHRDNIYQQLTVKYKRHSYVTFSIVTLQLVFSIFVILSNKYFIIHNSILFNILLSLILVFFWYKLHSKFNIKNI